MKKTCLLLLNLCLFTSIAFASLDAELGKVFGQSKRGDWSVFVQEADTKKHVYSLTPKRQLIPASNMKILVGAAGLLILGPDFTYKTQLFVTGEKEGSTQKGDLIVLGSGDPSIGGRFNGGKITALFDHWAEVLKRNGITQITGDLLGIDDVFDDVQHGLNWDPVDLIEWYAAEVSGLNLNDGCIDVIASGAAKTGSAAAVRLNPNTSYITVNNSVKTVDPKQEKGLYLRRDVHSTQLNVSGTIRVKGQVTTYATVPNPTQFFVSVMKETLEKNGVRIQGEALDSDAAGSVPNPSIWKHLDTYQSPRFFDIASVCLKRSQNLYAEQILKTLGAAEYGIGSFESGIMAIKNVFFLNGSNLDDQYIADGSGLSRENRMSAEAFVRVLQVMYDSKHYDLFRDTLALAGEDGTLRRRMKGTAADGRVFGKTGTMKGITALSGYIVAKSGKTYVFSMIANDDKRTAAFYTFIDKACVLIADKG